MTFNDHLQHLVETALASTRPGHQQTVRASSPATAGMSARTTAA
ncbi:hypothetical protein [Streptomyces sp. SGAir0957]